MVPSVTRITCYQCQCHLEGCTRKIQRSGNRSLQRKVSQTLGIRMEMIKRIMESRTVIASAVLYDQSGRCHSIDIQRRAQRSQDRGKGWTVETTTLRKTRKPQAWLGAKKRVALSARDNTEHDNELIIEGSCSGFGCRGICCHENRVL
jgi:hypothetical protein